MKIGDLLEKWNLTALRVKTPILELDWSPGDVDKDAAWDLYVELLTRVATQPIATGEGVEKSALESVAQLFPLTRETLKHHGRQAVGFSRIAIVVLNQIVRPFAAERHLLSERGAFEEEKERARFRSDLAGLQRQLRNYTGLLADLAGVENLTGIAPSQGTSDEGETAIEVD
ncbi:MAG: hypothetical protein AAGM22_08395 [Acidobacteriota bacterium]